MTTAMRASFHKQTPTGIQVPEPASECPNCTSDNWDFHNNDEARCRDCGERWCVEELPA
jgi:hypothetical protein